MSDEELPDGWASTTIGDLIAADGVFVDGDWVETKDQDVNGAVRLTQLADVGDGKWRNRSARFLTEVKAAALRCTLLKKDDVLVARMPDPLGRACLFPGSTQPCVTVVDVAIVRPGAQSVSPSWLMHFINSPKFRSEIDALQAGTTRKRISRRNLATIQLPVPPRVEQDRIVAELERRLSRIDVAETTLSTAGRIIERARVATLRAAADGSLTHLAADDDLADICIEAGIDFERLEGRPGWVRVQLGSIARVGSGATPKRGTKKYWTDGTIPWVTSGQIVTGVVAAPAELITEAALKETSVKLWPAGTLLVAMYGEGRTRGHCAELLIEATCNQACAAIDLKPEFRGAKDFVKLILQSQYEENRVLGSGGVQENLNLGLIKAITIDLPPERIRGALVREASRRISLLGAAAASVAASSARARVLRRSILTSAFSGRLVLQDPSDEPASELLARIRAERDAAAPVKRARKTSKKEPVS